MWNLFQQNLNIVKKKFHLTFRCMKYNNLKKMSYRWIYMFWKFPLCHYCQKFKGFRCKSGITFLHGCSLEIKLKVLSNNFSIFSSHMVQIYIYKAVISVFLFACLFVCPIITQKPLDRFASNFDWGTRKTHGNVLNLVKK